MRSGGSFIKEETGKVKKVNGTRDHPDGNRPRNSNGQPIDIPEPIESQPNTTAASKTKPSKSKE